MREASASQASTCGGKGGGDRVEGPGIKKDGRGVSSTQPRRLDFVTSFLACADGHAEDIRKKRVCGRLFQPKEQSEGEKMEVTGLTKATFPI